MWLLSSLAPASSLAVRAFHRVSIAGGQVPSEGPVLLVANHPNSLLDPALVAMAADRPVRFLAKAPLFTDPAVGWLVRAAGAIPIFRPSENPGAAAQNEDAFRAVHTALAAGDAVGIFPEGTTHNAPSLAPLKTGAARMALGAAALVGAAFPIIPVGLIFSEKELFRSPALGVIGTKVPWDDLAPRGPQDAGAVRELTRRIDAALRATTLNLEEWEDRPLIEAAEAIYAAEHELPPEPTARLARLHEATRTLARLRLEDPHVWRPLADDVDQHRHLLDALGLCPADLHRVPGWSAAARWTARRVALWALGLPLLLFGTVLFWLPCRMPGWIVARLPIGQELRATYKTLIGFVAFTLWIMLLALLLAWAAGPSAGVAGLIALPALAVATLRLSDRWNSTRATAKRFVQLRRRGALRSVLRKRQQQLAARLAAVLDPEPSHMHTSP